MDTQTPELDLDALLAAMISRTAAKFPALKTVDDYLRVQTAVKVPAIAFEITGIEQDGSGDVGTEQFAAVVTLSAYCLVSYKLTEGQKAKRRAASLAASFIAFLKTERWGMPIQDAEEINAIPDTHSAAPDDYEVWRVDWQHSCLFGASAWDEDAPAMEEILLGRTPLIGPGNEAFYERVDSLPKE